MKIRPTTTRITPSTYSYSENFWRFVEEFESTKSLNNLLNELEREVNPAFNPPVEFRIDPLTEGTLKPHIRFKRE